MAPLALQLAFPNFKAIKNVSWEISLVVQWLRPHASDAGGQGTKIAQAMQCSQYMCVCVQLLNCAWLFVSPWTVARQTLSLGFSRQEYWSGLPFLSPGDLPDPGVEPASPALAGGFFTAEPPEKPINMCMCVLRNIYINLKKPMCPDLHLLPYLSVPLSSLWSDTPTRGFPVLLCIFSSGASFPLEGHHGLIEREKPPSLFRHLMGRNFPSSSIVFTFSFNTYQFWLSCWLFRCLSGKESPCRAGEAGEVGSIPEWGSSPGGGNGNPLQHTCLGNPRVRGAWWATVRRDAKS